MWRVREVVGIELPYYVNVIGGVSACPYAVALATETLADLPGREGE